MSDFQKDLKEKWNKLSLFGSKKPKGFKGQGQKLGTADAPKVRDQVYGPRSTQHCKSSSHIVMNWLMHIIRWAH